MRSILTGIVVGAAVSLMWIGAAKSQDVAPLTPDQHAMMARHSKLKAEMRQLQKQRGNEMHQWGDNEATKERQHKALLKSAAPPLEQKPFVQPQHVPPKTRAVPKEDGIHPRSES